MKKGIIFSALLIIILTTFLYIINVLKIDFLKFDFLYHERLVVEKLIISSDKDEDNITDLDDIVQGALREVEMKPVYKSNYYNGGYPPQNEGVCTDVIWRAFKNAGFNLKEMVDKDIKENIPLYKNVFNKPDPNIDFRRVKNLLVFFKRKSIILTNQIKPYDKENLKHWQGGDIVIVNKVSHIAVISNKRSYSGVPYVIHSANKYPREENVLQRWQIVGHFRFKGEVNKRNDLTGN
jgi:uncharacterized protein YijF (DUF1287 family)